MVSGNEQAMRALLAETSHDVSSQRQQQQQQQSEAALNMRLQSGYLESGTQFSGIKVYHM
jgi:hypothetical protein